MSSDNGIIDLYPWNFHSYYEVISGYFCVVLLDFKYMFAYNKQQKSYTQNRGYHFMEKNTFLIFNDLIYDLHLCQTAEELKNHFLKRLKLLIPYSYASILFSDLSSDSPNAYLGRPICIPDTFTEAEEAYIAHADEDPLFWLFNRKESTLIRESDLFGDERRLTSQLYLKCYQHYDIFDTLQFSIVYQHELLGVLTLFRTKADGTFSDMDMFLMRSLGTHMNAVVHKILTAAPAPKNSQANDTIQELATSYHLTPKETELLAQLFSFKSNEEIAEVLQISTNTLQKHLQNIFRKFDVASKWELLKYKR